MFASFATLAAIFSERIGCSHPATREGNTSTYGRDESRACSAAREGNTSTGNDTGRSAYPAAREGSTSTGNKAGRDQTATREGNTSTGSEIGTPLKPLIEHRGRASDIPLTIAAHHANAFNADLKPASPMDKLGGLIFHRVTNDVMDVHVATAVEDRHHVVKLVNVGAAVAIAVGACW